MAEYKAIKLKSGDVFLCRKILNSALESPLLYEEKIIVELSDTIDELRKELE